MEDHDHLGPFIKRAISEQEKKGGFSLKDVPPGTKLSVETANSIYEITVVEGSQITVMGGSMTDGDIRFTEPIEALLNGSTWGTPLIKSKWIGEGMRMEIAYEGNKLLTTSPVKNVVIETTDGRFINLQWDQKD